MKTRYKVLVALISVFGVLAVGFACWLKFSKANHTGVLVSTLFRVFTAVALILKPPGDVPAADKEVDVRVHLLKSPMIVPATDDVIAAASEGDAEFRDIWGILSRRQSAATWDEFSSTYTNDSADHLTFSGSPAEGRAGWEANKKRWTAHRKQTVFGVVVVSAGTKRHAFVPLMHCEYHDSIPPAAPFCVPVGFIFDPARGWLIDKTLNKTTVVLLLMNRAPAKYSTVVSELKARYWKEILHPESQQPTRRPTGAVNN